MAEKKELAGSEVTGSVGFVDGVLSWKLIEVLYHRDGAALFAMAPHCPSTIGTGGAGETQLWDLRTACARHSMPEGGVVNYSCERGERSVSEHL